MYCSSASRFPSFLIIEMRNFVSLVRLPMVIGVGKLNRMVGIVIVLGGKQLWNLIFCLNPKVQSRTQNEEIIRIGARNRSQDPFFRKKRIVFKADGDGLRTW